MNARERFRETLLFGNPDKVPLTPGGPRESTRARWHTEGLPEDRNYMDVLREELGIEDEGSTGPHVNPGVSFKMIPIFEEKVLEHRDGHYVVQDWMGAITEISDEFDYTYIRSAKDFVTRKWHKFPVETRDDWEEMKRRFNPDDPKRFPEDFDARAAALKDRDYVASVYVNGPFWQLREWVGFENLCMMTLEQPEFVEEMAAFWTEFVSRTLGRLMEKIELDVVGLNEDMAYKSFSMISPAASRRFLQPSYDRWVREIKASGCPLIDMDSDGYIGELIPIWVESGINVCDPFEVAAGNDIVACREQFGTKMAFRMGIDKRAIAKGGRTMRDEVMRVVPPLLKTGGFIPGCDHGVPPDISWPDFKDYTRLLAELTGWL